MYTELFNAIYGQDRQSGMPRIAIGVLTRSDRGPDPQWVLMDEEGRIVQVPLADFVADLRYKDGEWHDVGPGTA